RESEHIQQQQLKQRQRQQQEQQQQQQQQQTQTQRHHITSTSTKLCGKRRTRPAASCVWTQRCRTRVQTQDAPSTRH
ncbi:unnamed protein product, partial [Closterium sp. NIES-54]